MGCCTDCSNVSCDDRCIEAVARLECRLSCGTDTMTIAACQPDHHDYKGSNYYNANHQDQKEPSGHKADHSHISNAVYYADKEKSGCSSKVGACTDDENTTACNKDLIKCCSDEEETCLNDNGSDCCKPDTKHCCSQSLPDEVEESTEKSCSGEVDRYYSKIVEGGCSTVMQDDCKSSNLDKCCPSTSLPQSACEKKSCCEDNCASITTTDTSVAYGEVHDTTKAACVNHLQRAFEQYAAYVEKGICICHDVLSKYGQSTCCGTTGDGVNPRRLKLVGSASSFNILKSCCAPQTPLAGKHCKNSSRDSCRHSRKVSDVETSSIQQTSKIYQHKQSNIDVVTVSDLEKGGEREQVLLNVTGMTCSGCGRKVENVLKRIEGLISSRVTFVSGLVELDINSKIATSNEVIQRLERETGFKCSRVISNLQSLDLLLDDTAARELTSFAPNGVRSVERTIKGVCRISYDPTQVGARSLLAGIDGVRLAPPVDDTATADGKKRLHKTSWATFLSAVFTIPVLIIAWADTQVPESTQLIVSLVLATFVQAVAVPEFYIGAVKSLIYSRVVETDMLVVISISAAYGYSLVASTLTLQGRSVEVKAFFETSTLLITLVLFGRFMAALARMRAVSAVSLRSLQAETATIVLPSGETDDIDARLLQFGDVFLVRPHTRIATDGEIIDGQSAVDESIITGECIPIAKNVGDIVIAGTINGSNNLFVRLNRLPGKNSITDIAGLVESALGAKPRIQNLADKFASRFIPVVILIAVTVFSAWFAISLKVRHENGGGAFGTAITYSIAVLAITCPCALGLAVPMVLVIAGGVAARAGIIVKRADTFERAHKVTDVVFDKTGTLTTGALLVVFEHLHPDQLVSQDEILSLTKVLTQTSVHPVAQAVHGRLQHNRVVPLNTHDLKSTPGAGIECSWRQHDVKIGNPFWLGIERQTEIVHLLSQGMTLLCLTYDEKLLATWGLKNSLRPEASRLIHDLQLQKLKCHIVSGDNSAAVQQIALELQIPSEHTAARQSPTDKQKYVERLMKDGRTVLFCGDGTNDAVAIAQADIGVQIESTSDVTRATADVVLLGGLESISALLILSRRVFRRIQFNFVWSAVYNIFAVLLAAGAFVKVRIPPAYAGLGEIVSIAPVIIAAMTLTRVRKPRV